jgi:hypothetical protein
MAKKTECRKKSRVATKVRWAAAQGKKTRAGWDAAAVKAARQPRWTRTNRLPWRLVHLPRRWPKTRLPRMEPAPKQRREPCKASTTPAGQGCHLSQGTFCYSYLRLGRAISGETAARTGMGSIAPRSLHRRGGTAFRKGIEGP